MSWGFELGRRVGARALLTCVVRRDAVSGVEASAVTSAAETTPEGVAKTGHGSGGSKTGHRLILPVLATTLGVLAFAAAPALAAAPTIIGESSPEVHATEARVEAVVNPENEPTECHFQYGVASVTEHEVPCKQEAIAGEEQGVAVTVTGLTQDTPYEYRVVLKNLAGEEAKGASEHFTTITPEPPETGTATPIAATTATLHGILNPRHAGEAGTYEFRYELSATECTGPEETNSEGEGTGQFPFKTAPEPAGTANGVEGETVQAAVTGLLPGQQYTFCLLAKNAAEETALGKPETFTTPAVAPKIASESVSTVESTEATLEAEIDPGGAATTYRFEYITEAQFQANGKTFTGAQSTPGESAGSGDTAQAAAVTVTTLQPATTYHYQVVAENEVAGKTETTDGPDKTLTTAEAPTTTAETCPNAQLRAEQPFGLTLPDCRAYEMVSPVQTLGQNATPGTGTGPRAATSGEAIAYSSRGSFGAPSGAAIESELLSRRGPQGWTTQNITPLFDPKELEQEGAYEALAFTPELGEGLASTSASLTKEAPAPVEKERDLYLADFATGAYRYVGPTHIPMGASTELTRVVFGEQGEVSEWLGGSTVSVSVSNEPGDPLEASVGDAAEKSHQEGFRIRKDVWHAVSGDGSRVYFTSPAGTVNGNGGPIPDDRQLYVRVNSQEELQSPLASPEANGTGTLTEGSEAVSALVTATGILHTKAGTGSTEFDVEITTVGRFLVGQEIVPGSEFEPGTKITNISGGVLTVSKASIGPVAGGGEISSRGPAPFAVGQRVSGNGVSPGTTIVGDKAGELTLSQPAAASGGPVELRAGGECTVPTDACTVDVSASQRFEQANPAGIRSARYWAASADGARVFFTSDAELTEDADTGPSGNAPNLYEYDLNTKELTDLTVPTTAAEKAEDAEGAAVQGVVQVSEEGQYVYFVAKGALAPGATAQTCTGSGPGEGCNLYVVHEGAAPVFVATLALNDQSDWSGEESEETGPGITTAVVSPAGRYLAFTSERSLTGYDNREAQSGECEGENGNCREVYVYDAGAGGPGLPMCASCDPSGARPVGPSGLNAMQSQPYVQYRPRQLLEDGTLFFDSSDTLVPHASDVQQNVYEYEDGRVYAISNVTGGHESVFLDSAKSPDGEEGGNVFFATADQLLPEDTSNDVVVYDARIGGGFPVTVSPAACMTAEACRAASSPPPAIYGPPASATFAGPGNLILPPPAVVKPAGKPKALTRAQKLAAALKSCRKDKRKSKRQSCEKQAKQKYGASKAKKSAYSNRRTH
jgi:hypothetical protein